MLKLIIFLTVFCIGYIKSKESFDLHYVNRNKGRLELSIIDSLNGNYNFKAVKGLIKKSIVQTVFLEQMNITGWDFLSVKTSNKYNDEWQAYYAGVSEGLVSKRQIRAHFHNTYENYCAKKSSYCTKLYNYLADNLESMIIKSRHAGGFWKMIRLMLWQIKGLQDAFDGKWISNATKLNDLYLMTMKKQVFGLYLLQSDGDLSELSEILNGAGYHSKFRFNRNKKVIGSGSCSAFIKMIRGEIYMSHVTWSTYSSMLRVVKSYDFPFRLHYRNKRNVLIPSTVLTFSSYPGTIHSIDDFYITSGGLVTIETTNGNYNKSLWKGFDKKARRIVLEYLRVQVANRLAKTGPEWIKKFSNSNSGTYNNQWMIINNNLMKDSIKLPSQLPDGVLYVAEQIPTLIISEDVTWKLRSSFWSSFNIPYNKTIWKISGFGDMKKKYGDFFSHSKGPRALIFKRNASDVHDAVSFMKLMRYNNFKHDPLAKCNCKPPYSGENGIASRSDLNLPNGTYPFGALEFRMHGATDMKLTTTRMARQQSFIGISGPTFDQQPIFEWKNYKNIKMKHKMQPDKFDFPPYVIPQL